MSERPFSYVHPSLRAVLERRIYHNRGGNLDADNGALTVDEDIALVVAGRHAEDGAGLQRDFIDELGSLVRPSKVEMMMLEDRP